jgi:hypothetical protein
MPAVSVVVTSAVVTLVAVTSEEAISVASILVEATSAVSTDFVASTSAVSGVSTSEVTGLHSTASADFTDRMDSVASITDIHFIGITACTGLGSIRISITVAAGAGSTPGTAGGT